MATSTLAHGRATQERKLPAEQAWLTSQHPRSGTPFKWQGWCGLWQTLFAGNPRLVSQNYGQSDCHDKCKRNFMQAMHGNYMFYIVYVYYVYHGRLQLFNSQLAQQCIACPFAWEDMARQ